jgi:hypothetical protein
MVDGKLLWHITLIQRPNGTYECSLWGADQELERGYGDSPEEAYQVAAKRLTVKPTFFVATL